MATQVMLTTREVSDSIKRQFGGDRVPEWKVRRVIDAMQSAGKLTVMRMGLYRTINGDDVGLVHTELKSTGWLT